MARATRSPTTLDEADERRLSALLAQIDPLVVDGEEDEALAVLERYIEAHADEHRLLCGALQARRANLLLDLEAWAEAAEAASEARRLGWRNAEVHDAAGWAHYGLDQPERARDAFERALSYDPDKVTSLMGHALILQEFDELDHARSDLTHAINVEPTNAELYAMRSEVLMRLGQHDEAERDIQQAGRLDPHEPDYVLAHARMLMVQGRVTEALAVVDEPNTALQDVVDSEQTALESLLLRSHLHLLDANNQAAHREAMLASNRYPDEAFAFVQLAHVQLALGNATLAAKAAERAVTLDPSLPDSYMVRGAVRQLQGQAEAAREDFERANRAPAELPMLVLGPYYEVLEATGYQASLREIVDQYARVAPAAAGAASAEGRDGGDKAGAAGPAGFAEAFGAEAFGGFDPQKILGQVFDESGEVKARFKPFLDMAMKNAPNILKNVPPSMLKTMGGLDPEAFDDFDFANLSREELEEQMKRFYELLQSGDNPFQPDDGDKPNPGGK